jgi:CheY-like chemotaxis protein
VTSRRSFAPTALLVLDSSVASHVLGSACVEEGLVPHRLPSSTPDLVERIAEAKPAVIVVRRTLDHLDGTALCAALRAHPQLRATRVLLVSSSQEVSAESRRAGAHGHLVLPCRPQQARKAIRDVLEARPVVLVVDDSRAQRMLVTPVLRAEGWEVLEAEDGEDALERVRSHGLVDLVVTDVEMPRLDGFGLCHVLKRQPSTSGVPVIMVTSLDSHDAIARGFAVGANDYLTKPVVLSELVARARRMLHGRSQPRAERVLVVDGKDERRAGVEQALLAHGLEVATATELDGALELLLAHPFQCVVADIDLRGNQDGVSLARAARAIPDFAELPFVLVTDRLSRADDVRATSAGVQAIVSRPYPPERLLAEVERVLGEARVRRQYAVLRRYLSGEALAAMTRFVDGDSTAIARAAQRHRTILFADLAGFTRLCEQRGPDEVVAVLNRFFDATVPILVRHGASIDKFIGDCIMAVYEGEEEGAVGALRGALEVTREVLPILRADLGVDLQLRVGVYSGEVTVGDIGSRDFRRDYTVIGDAVNIAQRLQSAADVGEVLVGESTWQLAREGFHFGEPRELQLKGRAGAVVARPLLEAR